MSDTWGIILDLLTSRDATVELSSPFLNMEFDMVTSEQHRWGAAVTSNPVEDGSDVADHIKVNPDTLEITGVISNASLSRWKGQFIERALNILDRESNVQRAFDRLRKLLENKQPVTVYTRYKTYPNMVLTSLSIPRSKDNGDAIEFTAGFTHIKRVKTITVDAEDAGINAASSSDKSTGRKSQDKQNHGKTGTGSASSDIQSSVDRLKNAGQNTVNSQI